MYDWNTLCPTFTKSQVKLEYVFILSYQDIRI